MNRRQLVKGLAAAAGLSLLPSGAALAFRQEGLPSPDRDAITAHAAACEQVSAAHEALIEDTRRQARALGLAEPEIDTLLQDLICPTCGCAALVAGRGAF